MITCRNNSFGMPHLVSDMHVPYPTTEIQTNMFGVEFLRPPGDNYAQPFITKHTFSGHSHYYIIMFWLLCKDPRQLLRTLAHGSSRCWCFCSEPLYHVPPPSQTPTGSTSYRRPEAPVTIRSRFDVVIIDSTNAIPCGSTHERGAFFFELAWKGAP